MTVDDNQPVYKLWFSNSRLLMREMISPWSPALLLQLPVFCRGTTFKKQRNMLLCKQKLLNMTASLAKQRLKRNRVYMETDRKTTLISRCYHFATYPQTEFEFRLIKFCLLRLPAESSSRCFQRHTRLRNLQDETVGSGKLGKTLCYSAYSSAWRRGVQGGTRKEIRAGKWKWGRGKLNELHKNRTMRRGSLKANENQVSSSNKRKKFMQGTKKSINKLYAFKFAQTMKKQITFLGDKDTDGNQKC